MILMVGLIQDRPLDKTLHVSQKVDVILAAKCPRVPFSPGPGGTSNPVDVGFRLNRQVVIEDISNVVHVDSPGGNVGCNQHLDFSLFELLQRTGSSCLRFVPMNRFGGNSGASQPITNAARPVLHFHEDDRPLDFAPVNHVNQQVILLGSIHVQHALVYFIDRRFFRIDLYLNRVHQNLSG